MFCFYPLVLRTLSWRSLEKTKLTRRKSGETRQRARFRYRQFLQPHIPAFQHHIWPTTTLVLCWVTCSNSCLGTPSLLVSLNGEAVDPGTLLSRPSQTLLGAISPHGNTYNCWPVTISPASDTTIWHNHHSRRRRIWHTRHHPPTLYPKTSYDSLVQTVLVRYPWSQSLLTSI